MIKTGIYNINQLKNSRKYRSLFGANKNLSITLYDQIYNKPNADELAERILLLFADERGAFKRTYTNRFELFDQEILKLFQQYFSSQDQLFLHDVGVSDGRTSCDFFEKLILIFPNITFYASDYNPKVDVTEKGRTKVTMSHTGKILEIVWPPFVFNETKKENYIYYPLNHVIRFFVNLFFVRLLIRSKQMGKIDSHELLLFSPKAIRLSESNKSFFLFQHDLLTEFSNKFHIIRAMNILNLSYFSELDLIKALKNIYNGLFLGGIFITGSNENAGTLVQGSVYKKTAHGFEKVLQSGNGSPIQNKVMSLNMNGSSPSLR